MTPGPILRALGTPALALALATQGAAAAADPVADGAYLARIMDCAGCHMPRGADGAPIFEAGLSGGTVGFEIPGLGVFWAPNLTPSAGGLGGWTDAEIADAIRGGVRPDGRVLAPAMPWAAYAALTDADAEALVAYLRSMPPVDGPRFGPVDGGEAAPAPFYRVVLPPQ